MFKKLIVSKAMRRRLTLIIAGVIILPFVIFFGSTGLGPAKGPGGSAGVLFGRQVSWDTFQMEQAWLRLQMGERFEALESILIPLTWERLMLLAQAQRQRLRVSDQELASLIQRIPAFQDDGRFVPDRYRRYVAAIGTTPRAFEELLRHDLVIEKLLNDVKAAVTVTDDDVEAAYLRAHERVKVSLLLIDPSAFTAEGAAQVTDEVIRAEYDAHPDDVRIPEQMVFDYAGTTREELSSTIQLSDAELSAFYEERRDEFTNEDGTIKPLEEVRDTVRQRLLDERVQKQLTTLSLDLQEASEAGLSFDEIVAKHGLVKREAGPLPAGHLWIPQGPDVSVLQAVADLKEGELSDVIQSDQGVYLARMTQRIPPRLPPLEEVQDRIRERLIATRARDSARERATSLRTQLQEHLAQGRSFEETAKTLGVTPVAPAAFTRTEPIDALGSAPAVNAAAFAAAVGQVTEVIETPAQFVIAMIHERLAPEAAGLTPEARDTLRQQVLADKRQAHTSQWLADLRARAKVQSFVEDIPSGS